MGIGRLQRAGGLPGGREGAEGYEVDAVPVVVVEGVREGGGALGREGAAVGGGDQAGGVATGTDGARPAGVSSTAAGW
ncbi:hypothetical protein [Streptomyces sp. NRRL B-3648]|uniref:hypothetical protein n=1 Tax=Streptomyces sp. NRRL B-3648 TaxID=1519493 RepID=UPI00131B2CE3|nr:hypothetical protein [Streptomyces sp. NRRL B-3648]